MSHYDQPLFVWPFMAGVLFLAVYLPVIFARWLKNTSYNHVRILIDNFFSAKTLKAAGEVFRESLLHLRIFRYDRRLGYMHMSLAFGWFLLIVVGKFGTMIFTHDGLNRFYLPIFLKYFYPDGIPHTFKGTFFLTIMDILLIFILSGLAMALLKRFRSRMLGMKRTTKHILPDRLALTFLWLPMHPGKPWQGSCRFSTCSSLRGGLIPLPSPDFSFYFPFRDTCTFLQK
jgi:hypothetical protein